MRAVELDALGAGGGHDGFRLGEVGVVAEEVLGHGRLPGLARPA